MGAAEPGYAERKGNKTKPAKKGPADSVRIERAENGYTVSCSHPPPASKPGECAPWEPSKNYVFETLEKATAFANEAFGAGKK